jgi:hypothetical protein
MLTCTRTAAAICHEGMRMLCVAPHTPVKVEGCPTGPDAVPTWQARMVALPGFVGHLGFVGHMALHL